MAFHQAIELHTNDGMTLHIDSSTLFVLGTGEKFCKVECNNTQRTYKTMIIMANNGSIGELIIRGTDYALLTLLIGKT